MSTVLGAAAGGLAAAQATLDTVANNMANVNTFAFKKARAMAAGSPAAVASPDGSSTGLSETARSIIFSPAAAQMDNDPLHFAIEDGSFFMVRDADGSIVFTRFGGLSTDGVGNVTGYNGRLLEPPVTVPDGMTQAAINEKGVITAVDQAGVSHEIGQISLVQFWNVQGLDSIGEGLYRETANSGKRIEGLPDTDGFAAVRPSALEASNVDIAEEYTQMVIAQRAYQACAKTFSVGDTMFDLATRLTR